MLFALLQSRFTTHLVVFLVGLSIAFYAVNKWRVHQIRLLKQEIELIQKEKNRLEQLNKQCNSDLSHITVQYNDFVEEIKRKEIEYNKRIKEYSEQIAKLKLSQNYLFITVPEKGDTCENLKIMLDKFTDIELQLKESGK